MSAQVQHGSPQYHEALATLKKTRDALTPENVLLAPVNSVIINVEDMKKKHSLSVAELTAGLDAVNAVLNEIKSKNTEKLLDALDQLEQFKSALAHSKLKQNLQYFCIAVALLIVSAVIVLAAIHFPPALLLPTITFAMGTTAIPGITGVLPSFTVGSIIMNILIGAGLGVIRPPVWKYSRDTFRAWQYDRAVKALETTIMEKKNAGKDVNLTFHAQALLDEIQHIKNVGNKTKGVDKLVAALNAVNAVLKNPMDMDKLQHVANMAENFAPPASRLTQVYNLFLAALVPAATVAVMVAFPISIIQNAGFIAHTLATQFLEFAIPYSGMGIGPNSSVSLLFLNSGMNAIGEMAVELPEKTPNLTARIKIWLGYKNPEPALLKPQPMNTAIKKLKKGLKASKIKSGVMREKMQTFKEQFDAVAKEERNKPVGPSGKK